MMEANGITVSTLHHRNDTHSVFKELKRNLRSMEKIRFLFKRLIRMDYGKFFKVIEWVVRNRAYTKKCFSSSFYSALL